jgi:hypothetical protein
LTDATRERPRGRPKSWTEDAETKKREAIGQRNMEFAIDHPQQRDLLRKTKWAWIWRITT